MQSKRPHPALNIANAQKRSVRLQGRDVPVWMAPDIDKLLNDFINVSQREGESLGDQRCPFGAVLWPSARALWEWLQDDETRWSKVARERNNCDARAIELGSGVGFLSALLARDTRWDLTATDYEPAYADYLQANCELYQTRQLPFLTLDWCEPTPTHLRKSFDLVIACDVFYDDSHLDSVPRIAAELLKPEGTLLLADPERFRFQTAVEKIGKRFGRIEMFNKTIENTSDEANMSGVINPNTRQTTVQILHCQNPLS